MKFKIIIPLICLVTLIIVSSCQRAEVITAPPPPTGSDTVVHGEPTDFGNTPETPTTETPSPQPDSTGEINPTIDILENEVTKSTPLDMRMLIISAKSQDPALEATKTLLEQVGVPYEVLISTEETLTEAKLISTAANGAVQGRFQGIILTEAALAYDKNEGLSLPESYESSFSQAEWSTLWQYERDAGVRQVALAGFPSSFPEDYGMAYVSPVDTTNAPLNIKLTNAGKSIFKSLKPDITIPVRYAYTYLAEANAASTVSATPIMQDAVGNIVGVLSTSNDGRERIALTMSHNPYLLHTQLFGYDLVSWLSQGVFMGERRMYLTLDVDDYFLESSLWNPATNSEFSKEERVATMKTSDVFSSKAGVERFCRYGS